MQPGDMRGNRESNVLVLVVVPGHVLPGLVLVTGRQRGGASGLAGQKVDGSSAFRPHRMGHQGTV